MFRDKLLPPFSCSLKMDVASFSDILVIMYQIIRRYFPQGHSLDMYHSRNLKPGYVYFVVWLTYLLQYGFVKLISSQIQEKNTRWWPVPEVTPHCSFILRAVWRWIMETTFTILGHWITFKHYLILQRTHKITLPQSDLRLKAVYLLGYINSRNRLQCSQT
jgi:hypothetical protein